MPRNTLCVNAPEMACVMYFCLCICLWSKNVPYISMHNSKDLKLIYYCFKFCIEIFEQSCAIDFYKWPCPTWETAVRQRFVNNFVNHQFHQQFCRSKISSTILSINNFVNKFVSLPKEGSKAKSRKKISFYS